MTPTIAELYMSETSHLLVFNAVLKCTKAGMLINAMLIKINKGAFMRWVAFCMTIKLT